MKSLPPFARTFYSESLLAVPHEETEMTTMQSPQVEVKLIDFEGDKVVEPEKKPEEWTTEGGIGHGYHGGLYAA